jgi:hypothetical protein
VSIKKLSLQDAAKFECFDPFERNSLLDIVRNILHFFLKIVDKRLIALNNLSTMDSLPQ